uniref:Uncharacterized protein n=1 Tax=Asparagus officinalis TaxID=4686 RepID=Q2AA29_ASPOF|nr:hypothetical protein 20.t00031 [Asparagus officinalis]
MGCDHVLLRNVMPFTCTVRGVYLTDAEYYTPPSRESSVQASTITEYRGQLLDGSGVLYSSLTSWEMGRLIPVRDSAAVGYSCEFGEFVDCLAMQASSTLE